MARELVIVWAGRHHRSGWEEICTDYRRRIVRWVPVRDVPVRARAAADDPQRQRAEGQALLAAVPDPVWIVALDSRGEMLDSGQLAERLARLRSEWPHPIAFVIGSDLGLDRAVLDAARWTFSLGRLTLSHELARAVLYEQLYRVLTIEAGMSYHREP
ncbi:MAG TPA: 23S rRNA (pseudouridine(1915)-N(3))-methyltransferase RlmH [Thermoanaerobaculia bacterium]|nr:23S rRNA (pseudouridine(1915)-N(3))-methyltransferase RlmH [Thermoanaerobaculia bacterium]